MLNLLFIGDIVGRPGRRAVAELLPTLKKKHHLDLVIANGENLAHGSGLTASTVADMATAGVDLLTSGNHVLRQKESADLLSEAEIPVLRPLNFPPGVAGSGSHILTVGTKKILILNANGRIFMAEQYDDPFRALDTVLKKYQGKFDVALLDFHGEATSEKVAMRYYLDGRVAAVVGTHTHVPTADGQVTKKGTAYITDVGMVGAAQSILGIDKDIILEKFLKQTPLRHEIPDTDTVEFNAALLKIDAGKNKAQSLELIRQTVAI